MKINSINSPSFQKTLIATAKIGDKDNPQPVKIYHMDDYFDYDELEKKFDSDIWQGYHYSDILLSVFSSDVNYCKYLVMESDDGEMICYSEISENQYSLPENIRYAWVDFLETAPRYSKENDIDRKYKYAGETMMACIVNLIKSTKSSQIRLDISNSSAFDFYKKCGFEIKGSYHATLDSSKFDKLLMQNASHIKEGVDMVV